MKYTVFLPLLGLTGVVLVTPQQATKDGCFRQWSDSRIACSTPYQQRDSVSEQQCRDSCNRNTGCRAVQFNQATGACHLFRSSTTRRSKRDAVDHVLQKRHGCTAAGGGGGGTNTGLIRPPPPVGPRPPPGRGRKKRNGQANCGQCQAGIQSARGYVYLASTGRCCPHPATQSPVPKEATCPAGQLTRYFLVEGYQLAGSPSSTFTANSERACIDACTNNRLPDGRVAPCRSFDYDTGTKKCSISLQPTGVPQTTENTAVKHYEKTCVDSAFGMKCPGPYFRGPQKILVGYAQAVTNAASAMECLQVCSNAQSRFGFTCSSIMYYYQDTGDNCILNSETRSTHPDLYVSENTDKVDYYEPGCAPTRVRRRAHHSKYRNRNVLKLKSSDYSGWTMCDGRNRDHKRFRKCSTLNPNNCQKDKRTCDPDYEEQYDTPDVPNPRTTTRPSPTAETSISTPSTAEPDNKPSNHSLDTSTSPSTGNGTDSGTELTPGTGSAKPGKESKEEGSRGKQSNEDGPRGKESNEAGSPAADEKMDTKICRPLIKPDGSKDCENGMRHGALGPRENCKPDKSMCID